MKRFMNDFAYRELFFFCMVTIVHIAVPRNFPIVMVYFYMVTVIVHAVLFAIGQFKFLFITYLVKALWVFILIMTLLIDPWCVFFQYRGNNAGFYVPE